MSEITGLPEPITEMSSVGTVEVPMPIPVVESTRPNTTLSESSEVTK